MKEQRRPLDELQDDHMDELIRLAFKYEDSLVTKQIAVEEPEEPLSVEEKQFANRIIQTAWSKVDQEDRKQERSKQRHNVSLFFHRFIPVAACIVLLLNTAIPVAIARSTYLRSKVMELLIGIDENQKSAKFIFHENDSLSFSIPIEWEGAYYPAYIPEGYTVAAYDSWESVYYEIEYSNGADGMIRFQELGSGSGGSSGVEGAAVSYATINGKTALIIQAQDSSYIEINWSTDDRWLILQTTGIDYEETIRIAKSVKIIINSIAFSPSLVFPIIEG